MKHRIKSVLAALTLSLSALGTAHAEPAVKTNFNGCTPAKTMYFAYTSDHAKAVEWCEVAGGYRYTYGPMDRPETQLVKKPGEIGVIQTDRGPGFAVKKGDIIYWTTAGRDGSDLLTVSRDNWSRGKVLSIIYMESGMGYTNKAGNGYKAFND